MGVQQQGVCKVMEGSEECKRIHETCIRLHSSCGSSVMFLVVCSCVMSIDFVRGMSLCRDFCDHEGLCVCMKNRNNPHA